MPEIRSDPSRADRAWLRRACHDVLQRSPQKRELGAYLGAEVAQVAAHLLRTTEAMQQWLEEELFYFLLLDNFRPRTRAIDTLPERLRTGEIDVRGAVAEIVLSPGFSLRNPGNDTFVTVLLEQCLGVRVQDRKVAPLLDAGKQMYDGRKARLLGQTGSSQADVVKIVLHDIGFSRHLLARHHQRLFGRPLLDARRGKDAPAEATVERLHADPAQLVPILAEWLASDAYRAALAVKRPRTDRQFIRALYGDLLEREPSHDELRNMRNALLSMADPTPLRAVMAKVILDSGKAVLPALERGREAEFVAECFLRYLGREPTQDEAAVFVRVLARDGVDARHVVRALLGSLEYQVY